MSGPNLLPYGQQELEDLAALGLVPNATLLAVSGGAAFVYGELGYIHTDGTVRKAQSDGTLEEAWAEVLCVEPAGVANLASGLFLAGPGVVTGLSGGTAGSLAYVSATAGAITTSVPGTGHLKIVGKWLSTTVLKFFADPSGEPFIL